MVATRTQFLVRHQVANLVNGVETTIDIPRPQTTPAEPGYAETVDHVTRLPAIREYEAGHVIIELPGTHIAADVFMRKIEIHKLLPTAQKGVAGPGNALFPSGAAVDSSFVRDVYDAAGGNLLATNEDALVEILGGEMLNPTGPDRSYPGLTLRAGEFVRLVVFNGSGADIDAGDRVYSAAYKLGLNQGDTGKP
jgi:hypothetical protein